MAIKGTTKIELTNVHTGRKEVVEHHNMITNVLSDMNKRMYGVNGMDTFLYMYAKQFLGANDPFWKAMFSGIILFEDALSDNADEYIFPAGNKVTGCGDIERIKTQDMTDSSCSVLGNFNSEESVLKDNMVKMVYDFTTSQGNGQISSIALCNKLLARSCYTYGGNMSRVDIGGGYYYTKNCILASPIYLNQFVTRDGTTYTIQFYYHDTDNLKINMSTKLNLNSMMTYNPKSISVDLGAEDYSYYYNIDDSNIVIFYSSTTGKFKYVCLTDGSVYDKDCPSGYDIVYPFDGYFITIKQSDSTYYYSIIKDDGTMLHENFFSYGSTLTANSGMLDNKYVLLHNGVWCYLVNILTGKVSQFYVNYSDYYNGFASYGGSIFNNIVHLIAITGKFTENRASAFSTWQPWLTTKNNLDTPVTKTADKTMKVTYTLTEA